MERTETNTHTMNTSSPACQKLSHPTHLPVVHLHHRPHQQRLADHHPVLPHPPPPPEQAVVVQRQ